MRVKLYSLFAKYNVKRQGAFVTAWMGDWCMGIALGKGVIAPMKPMQGYLFEIYFRK